MWVGAGETRVSLANALHLLVLLEEGLGSTFCPAKSRLPPVPSYMLAAKCQAEVGVQVSKLWSVRLAMARTVHVVWGLFPTAEDTTLGLLLGQRRLAS